MDGLFARHVALRYTDPLARIFFWFYVIAVTIIGVGGIVSRKQKFFIQWFDNRRGRSWLPVSALIDVVTVTAQIEHGRGGEYVAGYLGTLTYFYRNPDLQSGEYYRMFDDEDEAKSWAASYKGYSVIVHVDPKDPSHSVIREDDLVAATPPAQPVPSVSA